MIKGRVYNDYTAIIFPDLTLTKSDGTNHENWTSDLEIDTFKRTIWGQPEKIGFERRKTRIEPAK